MKRYPIESVLLPVLELVRSNWVNKSKISYLEDVQGKSLMLHLDTAQTKAVIEGAITTLILSSRFTFQHAALSPEAPPSFESEILVQIGRTMFLPS
jgi:hypothetical protein